MREDLKGKDRGDYAPQPPPDGQPIEPKGRKWGRAGLLKWVFFLLAILYVLLSYYHTPLLIGLGRYLVVRHEPQESDLIVCLAGGNVDRGLAVADAFQKGLAPRVFMAREEPPDGYGVLKERGIPYPESVDLMVMMLQRLGVPRSAFITRDRIIRSTFEEAELVREVVKEGGYRSMIIITSPIHSRRAWLVFRKVFEKEGLRILMLPSSYSDFKPEQWWKKRRYLREVIIEYEKLIYYWLRYLW